MTRRLRPLFVMLLLTVTMAGSSCFGPEPGNAVDRAGKPALIAGYPGGLTFVHFWASWCVPCRDELTTLAIFAYTNNIRLVTVSQDKDWKDVDRFLRKNRLSLLTYLDPERAFGVRYHVDGLPTTIVLNQKGEIVDRFDGAGDWSSQTTLLRISRLKVERR